MKETGIVEVKGSITEPVVTITTEAIVERDKWIVRLKKVVSVTSMDDLKLVADILKPAKGWLKRLEESRKEWKAPVLDLGRKIDTLAKEKGAEMEAEYDRVDKLQLAFQKKLADEAEAERRAEEARLRKIEEDAKKREADLKAQIAKQEADARQREADLQAKLDAAKTEIQKANLEARLKREQEEAAQKLAQSEMVLSKTIDKANDAIRESAITVNNIAAPKVAGLGIKTVPKFEILDMAEFYRTNPMFVELTPKTSFINSAINNKALQSIPGVIRVWTEPASSIRG